METKPNQESTPEKVGFLAKLKERRALRKENKEIKNANKAPKEPWMRKYGPHSPFRGPARVLQLVGLDKAATKFVNSQYTEEDNYSTSATLALEFDYLKTLGLTKEVEVVKSTINKERLKDKTYLLALAKLSKHTNLLNKQ